MMPKDTHDDGPPAQGQGGSESDPNEGYWLPADKSERRKIREQVRESLLKRAATGDEKWGGTRRTAENH